MGKMQTAALEFGREFYEAERKRRGFGTCERLEHQILWEFEYSGFIEQLAERPEAERKVRLRKFWASLGKLIESQVLDAANGAEVQP